MGAFLTWATTATDPEAAALACLQQAAAVAVPFQLRHDWEDEAASLLALFLGDAEGSWSQLTVLADTPEHRAALSACADEPALQIWLHGQDIGLWQRHEPLQLEPVCIPKPWGEEVWFTGIEQRGVSRVRPQYGQSVPLPWLLAAAPGYCLGEQAGQPPVLLKILAPWPEAGLGELYLELHEEKREVYIITGVDEIAWPDGVGAIRFGIDPDKRRAFADDDALRQAFVAAAARYEDHRREVDAWLDQRRREAGLAEADPAPLDWSRAQQACMPSGWQTREADLRQTLNAFIRLLPLRVGDVLAVPTHLPHSLQHGVRAVEFQTPVYERKILAFNQKVLTQAHWDSAEGAALMRLDAPLPEPLPLLPEPAVGARREQVVRFAGFGVDRLSLQTGSRLEKPAGQYRLLMGLSGRLQVEQQALQAEQAWFLPAAASLSLSAVQGIESTVFLESWPLPGG